MTTVLCAGLAGLASGGHGAASRWWPGVGDGQGEGLEGSPSPLVVAHAGSYEQLGHSGRIPVVHAEHSDSGEQSRRTGVRRHVLRDHRRRHRSAGRRRRLALSHPACRHGTAGTAVSRQPATGGIASARFRGIMPCKYKNPEQRPQFRPPGPSPIRSRPGRIRRAGTPSPPPLTSRPLTPARPA